MKPVFIALLLLLGTTYKATAYRPAMLVNCSIKVSPERGTYYVGIYRLMDGRTFRLGPFEEWCPSMIDADEYLY